MSGKKKGSTASLPARAGSQAAVTTVAMQMPEGFVGKRLVTIPSLALKKAGQQVVMQIIEPMHVSTRKQQEEEGGKKKDPATICNVRILAASGFEEGKTPQVGGVYTLIVPKVIRSNLEETYPIDNETGEMSYVGKSFLICNIGKKAGKSFEYHDFTVVEVGAA